MPLPELFMQELKARSDIAEIVSSYVNLKRRGRNLVGLCPFHSEKTPSFNLYPENGSFYCFGCGAGGDVITFIRQIENLDYMEAVRFLAQRAGLQMPESQMDDGMARLKSRILEINRETARFYNSVLNSEQGTTGLNYLQKRGLSQNTIRRFGLGYSASRYDLINYLKDKGFKPDEMVQANVASSSRSGHPYDRFCGRVMYPIIDLCGNVIAFGGRILTDEKPKYLNTSDTLVFRKSNGLFAMNFAKNSGQDQLILAEGYMDVISLHQAGFTNAIATLGTALTVEQARLMARYSNEVVVCYDSDAPGQKAASRAIPILREVGLLVKVLAVPNGKDPDEYIRSFGEQGHAHFKQLLENCGNDVEYRLQKIKSGCNMESADGRVSYLNGAAQVLATLESRIEQEIYAGKLAEEIGVERSSIMLQIEKNRKKIEKTHQQKEFREFQQQITGAKDSINPEKSEHLRAANAEEALIAFVFTHPDAAKQIFSSFPPENFCTSFNLRVYEVIMGKIIDDKALSLTDISDSFSVDEISSIARILARFHSVVITKQDAQEYMNVITQEKIKINAVNAKSVEPQDIQNYLQTLREQKK